MKKHSLDQEIILNNLNEGIIIIDNDETISFINKKAEDILGMDKEDLISKYIRQVFEKSRLPQVLRTRKKEVNQTVVLANGKTVITSRIPLFDERDTLKGAISVFNDKTEIAEIAEQVSDLKEIKNMLSAVFQSSDEAISVSDENGKIVMINPSYTRITGLSEKDIIGRPVDADISEGESVHRKALLSRRAVRGGRLKVGPANKDVVVNADPVIVDGKLKGSVAVLKDVTENQSLINELQRTRQIIRNLETKYTFDDIIGDSTEMKLVLEHAKIGAKTSASVIIRGEAGVGKDLFAQAIHNESERKHNKFIRVNCAMLDQAALEVELFGRENDNETISQGCFEQANQGSIFLDEVGAMSKDLQAKLLNTMEKNELKRIGSDVPVPINVRIIASTNQNLEKAITNNQFNQELYYKLNKIPINIPPLRERLTDLEPLVYFSIRKLNHYYGRSVNKVEPKVWDYLKGYDWPRNIKELENILSSAMIYMENNEEEIHLKHIPKLISTKSERKMDIKWKDKSLQQSIEDYEKKVIELAFKENQYNKTKTAESLGISIRNLYYKMDKYGLAKETLQ